MLKKISRKKFLSQYPDFPTANYFRNKFDHPETYDHYILNADARSTKGLCSNLSQEITKLLNFLNYTEISFLGDTTTPWLFREHTYKPVKDALDLLIQNKVSRSFNGAINISKESMPCFLKHIFWLVRCNGVLFSPYFSDVGFNIVGSICKYGNLHLSTLNKETDLLFNNAVVKTKLHMTDECQSTGKIVGRTTTKT